MDLEQKQEAMRTRTGRKKNPPAETAGGSPFVKLRSLHEAVGRAEQGESVGTEERRRAIASMVLAGLDVPNTEIGRLFGVSERQIRFDKAAIRKRVGQRASEFASLLTPPLPRNALKDERANEILRRIHEAAQLRRKNTVDLALMLSEVRTRRYWRVWGFFSFTDWIVSDQELGISIKEAVTMCKIVEDAALLAIPESVLRRTDFRKLAGIFRLDENVTLANSELIADLARRAVRLTRAEIDREMAPLLGKKAILRHYWAVSLDDEQWHVVEVAIAKIQTARGGTRGAALAEICDFFQRFVKPKPMTTAAA